MSLTNAPEAVPTSWAPADLARGLATDGLSAVLAGFMNSFPDTAFAENVGLVGLTRVRSRWVNLVFNHWTHRPKGECAVSVAVREGAVAVNVPDDGAEVKPQA